MMQVNIIYSHPSRKNNRKERKRKMYKYVCGLNPNEYHEWVTDRSTATVVNVFDNPEVDAVLCDPRVWIPLGLYALCNLLQVPLFTGLYILEQALIASIAAMTLTLGELRPITSSLNALPHRIHFLLFGISQKFRLTMWKTNTILALSVAALALFFGYPVATLTVIVVQLLKASKGPRCG